MNNSEGIGEELFNLPSITAKNVIILLILFCNCSVYFVDYSRCFMSNTSYGILQVTKTKKSTKNVLFWFSVWNILINIHIKLLKNVIYNVKGYCQQKSILLWHWGESLYHTQWKIIPREWCRFHDYIFIILFIARKYTCILKCIYYEFSNVNSYKN